MAIYGSFETVRELSNDLVSAVYAARRVGSAGEPEFAVKVIFNKSATTTGEFFADVAESGDATQAAEVFQAGIEVQRSAAQADPSVAAVLES